VDNDLNLNEQDLRSITSMGNMIEEDEEAANRVYAEGTVSALLREVNAKRAAGGKSKISHSYVGER
jgi:hypothetical protein